MAHTHKQTENSTNPTVGLETIHRSPPNLFLWQGRRGKEAAAKVILSQGPLTMSGKLVLLRVSTGQCRPHRTQAGHSQGPVPGESSGTRGPTVGDGHSKHPQQHAAQCVPNLQSAQGTAQALGTCLNQMYG